MRSSWTDGGRLLAAALLGCAVGVAAPTVGTTGALLTGSGSVAAGITVRACDPAPHVALVAASAPAVVRSYPAEELRPQDVASAGLPECDPSSGARDLAGAVGDPTEDAVALTTPANFTVSALLDATTGTAGHVLSLSNDSGPVLVVDVGTGGAVRVTHDDTVVTGPVLPAGPRAHLLTVVVHPGRMTLHVDGVAVASGTVGGRISGPLVLRVGALDATPAADVVVDEVLVLDEPLDAAAVAALWDAYGRW